MPKIWYRTNIRGTRKEAYVLSDGEPFFIGIGKTNREAKANLINGLKKRPLTNRQIEIRAKSSYDFKKNSLIEHNKKVNYFIKALTK